MAYMPPELIIIRFMQTDVITASTNGNPGEFEDENVDNEGWLLGNDPENS